MSRGYYNEKLAAGRLREVYETAPEQVQRYLRAEVEFVREYIGSGDAVLELGCGYGRVLRALAEPSAGDVTGAGATGKPGGVFLGIDNSMVSLEEARKELAGCGYGSTVGLAAMDGVRLGLADRSFDLTVCVQNGISAFHVDRLSLVREAVRVTKAEGTVLFSSYAEAFWKERLRWFEQQARAGLIGPIDYELTGDGTIVCTDGFRATTVSEEEFRELAESAGVGCEVVEVDQSSLFCVMRV